MAHAAARPTDIRRFGLACYFGALAATIHWWLTERLATERYRLGAAASIFRSLLAPPTRASQQERDDAGVHRAGDANVPQHAAR